MMAETEEQSTAIKRALRTLDKADMDCAYRRDEDMLAGQAARDALLHAFPAEATEHEEWLDSLEVDSMGFVIWEGTS